MKGLEIGSRVECDFKHDKTRSDMWGTRYRGVLLLCDYQRGKAWVELDTFRAAFEVDVKGVMSENKNCFTKMPEWGQRVEVLCNRSNEWWEARVVARNVMGEGEDVEVVWTGNQGRKGDGVVVHISEVRPYVWLPAEQPSKDH